MPRSGYVIKVSDQLPSLNLRLALMAQYNIDIVGTCNLKCPSKGDVNQVISTVLLPYIPRKRGSLFITICTGTISVPISTFSAGS